MKHFLEKFPKVFCDIICILDLYFFGVDPKKDTVLFNEVKLKADRYDTIMQFLSFSPTATDVDIHRFIK